MPRPKAKTVDEYISWFEKEVQSRLQQLRAAVKNAVPDSEEFISYGIPAWRYLGRYFLYMAAYDRHIGMYPIPKSAPELEKDLAQFDTPGRATIRFPHEKPLPLALVKKLARYRAALNEKPVKKSAAKAKAPAKSTSTRISKAKKASKKS